MQSRAGGVPIVIPLLAKAERIRPLVESLDGLLLTGNNSDLNPSLYEASRQDACGPIQPLREAMDFFLLETTMKRKIPILAICFGLVPERLFGRSLIQDIPSAVGHSILHSNPQSNGVPCHKIRISSGSVLESMAGGADAVVNSTHHQAVDQPGRGVKFDCPSSGRRD